MAKKEVLKNETITDEKNSIIISGNVEFEVKYDTSSEDHVIMLAGLPIGKAKSRKEIEELLEQPTWEMLLSSMAVMAQAVYNSIKEISINEQKQQK